MVGIDFLQELAAALGYTVAVKQQTGAAMRCQGFLSQTHPFHHKYIFFIALFALRQQFADALNGWVFAGGDDLSQGEIPF